MVLTKEKRRIWAAIILCLTVVLILGLFLFQFHRHPTHQIEKSEMALRQSFVEEAEKWLGCKEEDGTHKPIIDLYNSHTPLAQGYTVKYEDSWCATFVSAVAIKCNLTDIIPAECGCQRQIELFKDLNRWQEDDNYLPTPGDIIYYSTGGSKQSGDNEGWSDHVGIVVSVEGKTITVIEGNYDNQVKYRTIKVGHKLIRGYGLPDFASKI